MQGCGGLGRRPLRRALPDPLSRVALSDQTVMRPADTVTIPWLGPQGREFGPVGVFQAPDRGAELVPGLADVRPRAAQLVEARLHPVVLQSIAYELRSVKARRTAHSVKRVRVAGRQFPLWRAQSSAPDPCPSAGARSSLGDRPTPLPNDRGSLRSCSTSPRISRFFAVLVNLL